LLIRNKQDLAIDRNANATPKEILQLQSADILTIAIVAILAIAAICNLRAYSKPPLSCATLIEKLVLNYIYSKLRTPAVFLGRRQMREAATYMCMFAARYISK
jgi:hypothetical protein